jgi:hypothetical protein
MIKKRYIVAPILTTAFISLGAIGAANATTSHSSNSNNDISKGVFKHDKIEAEAQVLNTTPANIQGLHSKVELKKLVTDAGLNKQTFHERVKAEITTELLAQHYTQSQIDKVLSHQIRYHSY